MSDLHGAPRFNDFLKDFSGPHESMNYGYGMTLVIASLVGAALTLGFQWLNRKRKAPDISTER